MGRLMAKRRFVLVSFLVFVAVCRGECVGEFRLDWMLPWSFVFSRLVLDLLGPTYKQYGIFWSGTIGSVYRTLARSPWPRPVQRLALQSTESFFLF